MMGKNQEYNIENMGKCIVDGGLGLKLKSFLIQLPHLFMHYILFLDLNVYLMQYGTYCAYIGR